MSAEDTTAWARDLIRVEIQRAHPDALTKARLQEASGTGSSDVRAALVELLDDEEIVETADGYLALDADDGGDAAGVIARLSGTRPDAPFEPDGDDGEVDDGEDPAEWTQGVAGGPSDADAGPEVGIPLPSTTEAARAAATGEAPRYVATLAMEVSFYAEPRPGEQSDAAAQREAQEMVAAIRDHFEQRWKGTAIAPYVFGIEVFERSRTL